MKVVTPLMHHASGRGLWSTLLLAAVLVSAIALMGFALPMAHSGSHTAAAAHPVAAVMHPAAPKASPAVIAGNASGTVVITSHIPVYMTLPYALTWAITTTNATPDKTNVSEAVSFTYLVDGSVIVDKSVALNPGHPLTNEMNVTVHNLSSTYANGALLEGSYLLTVTLVVTNTSQAVPQPYTTTASAGTQLSAHFPTGKMFNPFPGTNVSQGTVTMSGEYNGSFVNSANVTVYNSTHTVVFVQGVFSPQTAPNAQEGFSVNTVLLSGTYTLVLTLGAAYNHTIVAVSETFTVLSSTPVTYFNTSGGGISIGGLGAGGSAALLMVVGLIIGMLVGVLVARGMAAPVAGPAQPWSGQAAGTTTTGATTAANECSVCHQSFGSASELSDHMKSQHGITQ